MNATMQFSPARVGAMVRRYWYLLRSSWPRILDLIYWPAVQMLMRTRPLPFCFRIFAAVARIRNR